MKHWSKSIFFIPVLLFIFYSCGEKNDGLAPYEGSPGFSKLTVQDTTFRPKITWLGGYVSVFGINVGSRAALDSTLVFLIYKPGNDLRYPITSGQVPSGAQDLTSLYGGARIDSLSEDSTYTFWILKENEWNQISSMRNEILVSDPAGSASIQINGDTVRLSDAVHNQVIKPINVYINISIIQQRGRLGKITIEQTNRSNDPIISFTVTQADDQLISAIGITEGGQFNQDAEVWSALSVSTDSAGEKQYAKANVISSPVIAGAPLPGTQVFAEYPEGGLKHNTTYYLWIANKLWNGEGRLLSTDYYAYVTFSTK